MTFEHNIYEMLMFLFKYELIYMGNGMKFLILCFFLMSYSWDLSMKVIWKNILEMCVFDFCSVYTVSLIWRHLQIPFYLIDYNWNNGVFARLNKHLCGLLTESLSYQTYTMNLTNALLSWDRLRQTISCWPLGLWFPKEGKVEPSDDITETFITKILLHKKNW
jgi:hypothetical protein